MKIKKYKGNHKCEAAIGFNEKRHQIILCKNKAELTYFRDDSLHRVGVLLCKDCWEKLKLSA